MNNFANLPPLTALIQLIKTLRDKEQGCPWDKKQNFETIAPYTIEEAYEVLDAINSNDHKALKEELGDLLFQIAFYSELASELDLFDFNDVVIGIIKKKIERHPQIFAKGDNQKKLTEQTWNKIKAEERKVNNKYKSSLDGIAKALPTLLRAQKFQKRAANLGFDWKNAEPVFEKVLEELDEIRIEVKKRNEEGIKEEIGDLLFTCVNLARHLEVDPENALRSANEKFVNRFQLMEEKIKMLNKTFKDFSEEEMEKLWSETKNN